MKPELSNYQASAKNDVEKGSRLISWIVLGLATSGFVALAWYAYQSGTESVMSQEIATIEAEESPIKVRPDDAGGEEFPHQDKTIYDVIAPSAATNRVETLLPEPEEPILPTVRDVIEAQRAETEEERTAASTWVNEKLRSDATQPTEPQLENAVETTPVAVEDAPQEVAEVPVATAEEAVAPAPEEAPNAAEAAPEPIAEPTPKPEAPEAPARKTGGHTLQLGAFGSEEEAEANWVRIRGQNTAVLDGYAHKIIRADLPKGTFYRLRVSGFVSKDTADAACKALSAKGQGCFYAGK